MEHSILILMLCIVSSVFFTSCDSLQLSTFYARTHAASDHDYQLTHPGLLLPIRKLKLREDHLASVGKVYNEGDQDLSTHNAEKDAFSAGKAHNKELIKRKQTPIRTWREWVEGEGSETSQYFTMDYSHVRRRRPIHNKSLQVAP